ncbi:MAG: UbiX family flavin prenyltransferase [Alphaproteobacteria bacterium]
MSVRTRPARLIVGISGASGVIYGVRLLELLREVDVETHLIMTKSAQVTLALETEYKVGDVLKMATHHYDNADIAAAVSSGSFHTMGMVIAPCSMRSLAEIATGVTGNLLSRAADVALKERRRLVLMARETPLHLGHLRNMVQVTEMGAVVYPPSPAFYTRPTQLQEVIDQSLGRMLDLFEFESSVVRRWGEDIRAGRRAGGEESDT